MPDALIILVLAVAAVAAGGPLTVGVFRLADRRAPPPAERFPMLDRSTLDAAGAALRGGAWIGALERLAIYASLVVGWREMVAVALAIKGLARYPELRAGDSPAVAERFIIGTFVSVLWACGCAGLARSFLV